MATGEGRIERGATPAVAIRRLSARHFGNWWGRLQPAADFSPPAAGFTSFAGRRAEARRRLKSAPQLQDW